jgi:hypothetical protein
MIKREPVRHNKTLIFMRKPVPPAPKGWNKTLADLFEEMKRGERVSVDGPEVDWARDYERSQIPTGMRFPRKGDIYEALEDMTVEYMTSWKAPYTGGGEGILKKGDRVIMKEDSVHSQPIRIYALAEDYDAVEERMVPSSDRSESKYSGFYFSFSTMDLNRKFKLVHEE